MELSITPQDNNCYYIYIVKDESNNILFVNADRLVNIVSFQQLLPNPKFNPENLYKLEIYTAHKDYYIAMNAVSKLIKELCGNAIPPLNLVQHYNRNSNVKCNETGVVYRNAADACRSLGIASPRMSNHLKNKVGHKTIKGMTYSYCKELKE